GWRLEVLAGIALDQARANERDAAARTFRDALAEAETVRDGQPGWSGLRGGALNRVLQAQAEAGWEKEAVARAEREATPRGEALGLLRIAEGLLRRGGELDSPPAPAISPR